MPLNTGTRRSMLAAPAFTPRSLPGLLLWFDAGSGVFQNSSFATPGAAGAEVGGWQDLSGNANHLTQATVGNKPSLTAASIAGRPGVRFDGVDDFLSLGSAVSPASFSLYMVQQSSGDAMMLCSSTINRQIRIGEGGLNRVTTFDGANSASSSDLGVARTSFTLLELVANGSTVSFYDSGTARGSGTINSSMSMDQFGALSAAPPQTCFTGTLAALVLFSVAHDADARARMETYLRQRFAL